MKNKNYLLSFKSIWEEYKGVFVGIGLVLCVAMLTTVGQSQWFKSSLLETSNPFNGTIYPIEKSPDYTIWMGSVKTTDFKDIDNKYLTTLPNYEDALLDISVDELKANKKAHNAKLTFPVVYLGSYENNHLEKTGSHLAVDIRVPINTPIRAIANGTVVKKEIISSGFGHHICISHKNVPDYKNKSKKVDLISCYNHMNDVLLEKNDFVFKGQQVGTSGNTGTSTTPHLHFQIDRSEAPWHPWWPFSWTEASAVSLSFFDAVNAGLNKDKAEELTVNPMLWIKENYSEEGINNNLVASINNGIPSVNTKNTSNPEVFLSLSKFEITTDKATFYTNEDTTLVINAKDQNNNTFKTYNTSSNFDISSTSSSAEFTKILNFTNGTTKLVVKNEVAEDFEMRISEGDKQGTILLITKIPEENISNVSSENTDSNNTNTENTITTETQEIRNVVFSGDTYAFIGGDVSFYAELKNSNNETIVSLSNNIDIQVDGKGKVSPERISTNDINNGKTLIKYTSNEAETARIIIEGVTYEITIIDEIKKASAFKVYNNDNTVIENKDTEVFIQTINSDNEDTPNYSSSGIAKITFEEGEGIISPKELKSEDFTQGKASVKVRAKKGLSKIKIRVQNGAYVGISSFWVKEEKNENIFTDVPAHHNNAEAIEYLKNNGIIKGYDDGSFKPNKKVSRIEALKMLILGLNKGLKPAGNMNFPDTETGSWYEPYIGRALNLGMVKGYPDGSFKPANEVNRAEYYKILVNAAGVEVETFHGAPYEDVPKETWFTDYVGYAKENGITDAQTKFDPSGNVTRAEVAETLYRILKLI